MKTIHPLKSLIWLLIFACFLLEAGARSGLVFCFGSDGHVAIESSGACGTPGSTASSELQFCVDHCGPCVDFPFFHSATQEKKAQLKHRIYQVKSPVAMTPGCASVFVEHVLDGTVSIIGFSRHIVLASHRSVVLLI